MRSAVRDGIARALTLAPGIAPLGIIFGASAAAAGVDAGAAVVLSALVFAGGAQFAAIGLVAAGESLVAAAGLVAIVNSRYFLLSAATLDLARQAGASRRGRIAAALGVVDESFALQAAMARQGALSLAGLLAIPATLWVTWVGTTLVGALLGSRVPDLEPLGLDYALPGIFVGLVGIFADTPARVRAALAAIVLAGALALAGWGTLAVLVVPPALAFAFGRWAR